MIEPTRQQLATIDELATKHASVRVGPAPLSRTALLVACLTRSGRETCRYRIDRAGMLTGIPRGSEDRHHNLERKAG